MLKKKKNMEAVVSNLCDFVVNELLYASDIDTIDGADELLTTGLLDSLGSAQLMAFAEETWAIKFAPADLTLENFNTLEAFAALIARHAAL